MIKVIFYKDSDDCYTGFQLKGHAGFAAYGKDIVCAGVSVLAINTVNSIEALTEDRFRYQADEKKGLIEVRFFSKVSKETTLLLDSFWLGLNGIQEEHTGYLSVKIRRWKP
ncbi:MAG: ribosomal-processing cysteine protease Prp [Lachnospiraceae bacterium]|nr:ribosomal-processing cysteine protease Prp [Lachnospiraceae bacterium]